jgi:rubrerythrin
MSEPMPTVFAASRTQQAAVRIDGAPEAHGRPRPLARPVSALETAPAATPSTEAKTLCDRCGAEMYRMHAVWRCPACGFKTDCCGW